MSYLDDVKACLGPAVATYAANKRKGGSSGKKGSRFEDYFAIQCLAEHAVAHIETATGWPVLHEQADALVDDLVLEWPTDHLFYQLKNVLELNWTSGEHPIANDFAFQAALAKHQGLAKFRTILVVSTKKLHAKLAGNIPTEIAVHSEVAYFPYFGTSFNQLVIQHEPLRKLLAKLTRVPNPTDDELGYAFGALLVGMMRYGGGINASSIYDEGKKLSPNLLRLLPAEMAAFKYEAGFEEILAKVPGLSYGTDRGFFWWEAFGTSGVLSYNCMSKEFGQFQAKIVQYGPMTSFDDFEGLLP